MCLCPCPCPFLVCFQYFIHELFSYTNLYIKKNYSPKQAGYSNFCFGILSRPSALFVWDTIIFIYTISGPQFLSRDAAEGYKSFFWRMENANCSCSCTVYRARFIATRWTHSAYCVMFPFHDIHSVLLDLGHTF